MVMAAAVSPSFAQRHKIQASDPAVAKQILARGGHLVADYDSYQLYEVDQALPELDGRRGVENREQFNHIELNAGDIDTSKPEVAALRKIVGRFSGKRMHLVQFAGPVQSPWFDALLKTGVTIVDYVPNNTYIVYGDATALAYLQSWATASSFVQWEGSYQKDHKIHPRARSVDSNGAARSIGTEYFTIQLQDDPEANADTLTLINRLRLEPITRESRLPHFYNITVKLDPANIDAIAAQPDVVSIHPYFTPQKLDERQDQIIAGNLSGNSPTGPGYLAWLASKGFTQAQFTTSGFVVDLSDSGIDNGTTSPGHFGLYTSGDTNGGGRVVYNRLEGTPNTGSTLQGCDGHGNINAHIIAAFNSLSNGFPHADSAGYLYDLGVCPFVKVGSSVIFDPGTFTSPNYANLQSQAYHDGARISNNSWGANTAGAYDSDAQSYDALVRDAQPSGSTFPVAGNQEMVIVFAAGNAGSGAQTVGSPGTAKNVIVVGAAENVRSMSTANGGNNSSGNDGCTTPDTDANNANDIVGFSSRGPCTDGRVKPDIAAPGSHITGGAPQTSPPPSNTGTGTALACFTGEGVCALPGGGTSGSASNFFPVGQRFYTESSGTSHSTPCVAGACALIRQYFINNGLTPPSPAMTKAFLMNSARYMTGASANDTLPSNNQGMGELNLGTAFDSVTRFMRDEVSSDLVTNSGATRTFLGMIADPSKPFHVTLAWTDAPGPTSGSAYKNDLDLTVTVGGNTYRGNVFSGANSVTGGTADPRNNAESVFLPAGMSGPFTVTVTAANINSDGVPNNAVALDQDFALVVYNGSQAPVPAITGSGTTLTAESCVSSNGVIDPNETVTIDFGLQNVGSADASNVIATLLATGGVTSPSGAQTYGLLNTNGNVIARSFSFTANGNCGGNITATLQLEDGTNSLGNVTFTLPLGALGAVSTNTYSSGGISAAIPDQGSVEIPITITDTGVVTDVNVRIRLNHTFDSDLVIALVHPDGSTINLAANRGSSGDNYGSGATSCAGTFTVFDDSAATAIGSGTAPFAGTFKPEQPLAALNGKPTQGTWKLRVNDTAAADTGTVYCVQLDVAAQIPACCSGPVNFPPAVTSATALPGTDAFSDEPLSVTGVVATDPELEPITLAYQWQFTSNGVAFVDQAGATNTVLTAVPGNSGKLWRCRITPSDAGGTGTNFFTASVAVNNRPNMLGRQGQFYSYDSDLFLASTGGGGSFTRSAIINEFSQGTSGSQEWVELLFLKNSDARGWKLFDSNSGTVTFSSAGLWTNVPAGTLLVIYNGAAKDTVLPADDTDPSDGTLVIPHSNATFFSGSWISLGNSGDSINLSDSSSAVIHALSYGDNATYTTPKLGTVGSTTSAAYTNNTESGVITNTNWQIVSASSATPVAGNGTANSNFVANLRSGAFNVVPLFRFGASGDSVPGLSIDATNGLVSGTINSPTGGFYNVVIERFAGTNLASQQYNLLVGDSNNVYTVPVGKTWAINMNYTIPGTLIVHGLLDTAGHTLVVSNILDVSSGAVSNATGTIVYYQLVGGPLPGINQQFNSLPVISAASLSPIAPTTTNDLVANVTSASDADGDTITFAYQWQQSVDSSNFSNIAFTTNTLPAAATVAGDYYLVTITPNDGKTNGAPFTTASVLVPVDADSNGLNDDWEVQYFGHIGVDPIADADGDGFSNLQEYLAGTDPTNLASVPVLNITGVQVTSVTQMKATIEWTTDVVSDSRVLYGTSPSSVTNVVSVAGNVTNHAVKLTALAPGTHYYFDVSSTSSTDGTTTDNNQDAHYTFTTTMPCPCQ
jgi:subtilisin-like proprotein convertase family protein